jgi:hypothetical protein
MGNIPPNSELHFEIELLDFKDKEKTKYDYNSEEKNSFADLFKKDGNL